MARRLYRSYENKMLGGVCAGLGDYFDIDPTVLRILAVISLFVSGGVAIIGYIVAWIIVPKGPMTSTDGKVSAAPSTHTSRGALSPWATYFPGLILIVFGTMLLIREHWFWFSWGELWPLVLIAVGLVVIFAGRRSSREQAHHMANKQESGAENHGATS